MLAKWQKYIRLFLKSYNGKVIFFEDMHIGALSAKVGNQVSNQSVEHDSQLLKDQNMAQRQ